MDRSKPASPAGPRNTRGPWRSWSGARVIGRLFQRGVDHHELPVIADCELETVQGTGGPAPFAVTIRTRLRIVREDQGFYARGTFSPETAQTDRVSDHSPGC